MRSEEDMKEFFNRLGSSKKYARTILDIPTVWNVGRALNPGS